MSDRAGDTERTLTDNQVLAAARSIYDAERARTTLAPFTDEHPRMTLADGYAIQQQYAELRLEAGARLVGHKIGATSAAIQELFGVLTPDFGHLFADMQYQEGQPIPIERLIQPMTEPEIAFVLHTALQGPGVTAEDVLAATRGIAPCIEVIDSRIHDWQIQLPDTVADNGSSAAFVVASELLPVNGRELADETVELRRGTETVERGRGDAVLGHPANSVAWLANAIAPFGGVLAADSYVLSGSFTTAVRAHPGESYEAAFSTIGAVMCTYGSGADR